MPGADRGANTAVHVGPDGEDRAVYRKIHMFDVEVGGRAYRESEHEAPGDEPALSATADGTGLGITICYDLRFPELYRLLATDGAKVLTVSAAFTETTTREHWEVLLRARAIEDQCYVVASNQIGEHAPGIRSGGRSMIVDPWGVVLATAPDAETVVLADLDLDRLRVHPDQAPVARQPPAGGVPPRGGRPRVKAPSGRQAPPHPRRGGARVRAPGLPHLPRRGHRRTRPASPTASSTTTSSPRTRCSTPSSRSAGTCCSPRSTRSTRSPIPARAKLEAIASFIVDSYRHDRELMKVIIVEVTRAANTFGQTHLPDIRKAYARIADIVAAAQADGSFRDTVSPEFAAMAFYGAIEQVLTGWIFGLLDEEEGDYERAKRFVVATICEGLEVQPRG